MPATFLVKDALTLKDWIERFDIVIEDRRRYVEGAAVPALLQRREAEAAWAGKGAEEGTARQLRRGPGDRWNRADKGRGPA